MTPGWFWQAVRYASVYIFVAHTYIILFNLKINAELYDRFILSYLAVPNFIENAELASLYKIFEFCSLFAAFTIWNPFFFLASGVYTGFTRLNSFSNILPVYLTRNFRPLKLSRAELQERTIAAYPLFTELAISALMVLVVAHFVVSSLCCSESRSSASLTAGSTLTQPQPRYKPDDAGQPGATEASHTNPTPSGSKKSKQTKAQNKRSN